MRFVLPFIALFPVAGCTGTATSLPPMDTKSQVVTMRLVQGQRMEIVTLQNHPHTYDPAVRYRLVVTPDGQTGLEWSKHEVKKTWVLSEVQKVSIKEAGPKDAKGDEQILQWQQPFYGDLFVVTMGVPSWYGDAHPLGHNEQSMFAKMVPDRPGK